MATQETTQYQPQPLSSTTGQGQQNAQYRPQQIQIPQAQQQQGYQTQTTMMTQQPGMMMAPGGVVGETYGGCQGNARIVAYIDIVISIIECILCIVVIIILYLGISALQQQGYTVIVPTVVYIIMFFGAVAAILAIVDVCIACGLLTATNQGTPRAEAIRSASCWRNYNICLIIFTLIRSSTSAYNGDLGSAGFLWLIVRIIFVVIVHKYVQELQMGGGGMMGVMVGGVQQVSTTTTMPGGGSMQYQQPNQYNQYQQQQSSQHQQQYQ